MFSCLIFNINCGIRNVLELVSVVSLCHMSRLHSSHVTAEAELHPDIVCDVCGAPAANTEQHREACVCVCVPVWVILGGSERWRWSHAKQSDQCKQEVLGNGVGWPCINICTLVIKECTGILVNNPLCSGSAYLTCSCCSLIHLFPSVLFSHRNWGNMDYCIIMHYLWSFPPYCWLIWLEICRR